MWNTRVSTRGKHPGGLQFFPLVDMNRMVSAYEKMHSFSFGNHNETETTHKEQKKKKRV